jgi:hypothetical protein
MTTGSAYIVFEQVEQCLSIAVVDRLDKHFRRLTKQVFARYGFAYGDVLSRWSAIVGDDLGRVSVPERIRWPRPAGPAGDGRKSGGTLVLRVAEGRALEFQHLGPRVIERINSHYGYEAVAALKIVQGPVAAPSAVLRPNPGPEMPNEAVGKRLEAIADDGLRAALMRLGTAVSRRDGASSPSISPTRIQS